MIKIGETVCLKTVSAGRRYKGKVKSITTNGKQKIVRVSLPNGLYAERPEGDWMITESEEEQNIEEG